jgi:U32 family peptidase
MLKDTFKKGLTKKRVMVEIMAPAGSYESLMAAINAGANSVYFGVMQLNMRARAANNFTLKDMEKIVKIAKENNVKTYLTVNTVMYDHDMNLMKQICDKAKEVGITAVIASDLAAIQYANEIGVEVHISTQTNVSNLESVKFFSKFADVIVLARELTLKQIQFICEQIKELDIRGPKGNLIEIELFAHGALCVAVSGKCYMSLATYNASANRGACLQNCRRSYRVIDEETGQELVLDNKHVMSPKDLCTIGFIDKLLDVGVKVLKIEGRGRAPEYVHTVISVYREAVDDYNNGKYSQKKVKDWITKLETVYNRGFWHGGYYLGKELEEWSASSGTKATKEKVFIGVVENFYNKVNIAQFKLETREIKVGDSIIITGPTTGVIEQEIKSIFDYDNNTITTAKKGDKVTIPVEAKVRKNDKLFVVKERCQK